MSDANILELLTALEESPDTTQRGLSKRLGIALGMTNTLLRRAAKQGWLTVRRKGPRNVRYEVTSQGLVEKGRLMVDRVQATLGFYAEARKLARVALETARKEGLIPVAIHGTSNVSEILYLTAKELGIEVTGVVEPARHGERWLDLRCMNEGHIQATGARVVLLDELKHSINAPTHMGSVPVRTLA
ncbi:MAG: winged helix-turn-helix transcriptional regulator [Planctomycetota bacterium]